MNNLLAKEWNNNCI